MVKEIRYDREDSSEEMVAVREFYEGARRADAILRKRKIGKNEAITGRVANEIGIQTASVEPVPKDGRRKRRASIEQYITFLERNRTLEPYDVDGRRRNLTIFPRFAPGGKADVFEMPDEKVYGVYAGVLQTARKMERE
jgi:hypothetical protein